MSNLNLLQNKIFEFSYNKSETLFKILFDKYTRPEIFEVINKTGIHTIKNNKEKYLNLITNNLKWIGYKNINSLQIEEEISNNNLEILEMENKSLTYLKFNLKAIFHQTISLTMTTILFGGLIMSVPFKRLKNNKYLYGAFIILTFNILIYNGLILYTVHDFNILRKKDLENIYKRQIEKYEIISNI